MTTQISLFQEVEDKTYVSKIKENIAFYGTDNVGIYDLVAVLVGKEDPELVSRICAYSSRELISMSKYDFMEIDGICEVIGERLEMAIALGVKLSKTKREESFIIRSPGDVVDYLKRHMSHLTQEEFKVICISTKNEVIAEKTVFIGSLNSAIVHPREIFSFAIKKSAASIIVSHNHPSGSGTIRGRYFLYKEVSGEWRASRDKIA